jgi:hypothetical protein
MFTSINAVVILLPNCQILVICLQVVEEQLLSIQGHGKVFKQYYSMMSIDQLKPRIDHDSGNFVIDYDTKLWPIYHSIKDKGIRNPLSVSWLNDHYEITVGSRRWWAAKRLGIKQLPCIVNDVKKPTADSIELFSQQDIEKYFQDSVSIRFFPRQGIECISNKNVI